MIEVRHAFDGWYYMRGATARYGFGTAAAAMWAAFHDVPGVPVFVFMRCVP